MSECEICFVLKKTKTDIKERVGGKFIMYWCLLCTGVQARPTNKRLFEEMLRKRQKDTV